MSYSFEITLWCDGCPHWDQISEHSVRRARSRLKKEKGWSYRGKNDYCPRCTALGEDAEQQDHHG